MSSLWSYLQDPNNINFIEGKRVYRDQLKFNRNELKVAMFRVYRIKNCLEIVKDELMAILRFKFPNFSYFWLSVVIIGVWFFDMNRLVPYIMIVLMFTSVCIHRQNYPYFDKFIKKLCEPQSINKDYIETLVNTRRYIREHRYLEIDLLRKKLKST